MKIINKIITLLAAFLAASLTATAQSSATLDLSVTLTGLTPNLKIFDNTTDTEISSITFPAIDSNKGEFTAISGEYRVEVAHSGDSEVLIYSDDAFSNGFDPDNTLFLKKSGTSADTEATPNPDNVLLKIFVTSVNTNNTTYGPFTYSSLEDFIFVFDKNSTAKTILMGATGNAVSSVQFVFGLDARTSNAGTYSRSLTIESVLK